MFILFFRFYLKLIVCYELFTNGKYDESLSEVEDLVMYMGVIKFDKSNKKYIDAYNHILQSTHAFITTSMNDNNYEEAVKYLII